VADEAELAELLLDRLWLGHAILAGLEPGMRVLLECLHALLPVWSSSKQRGQRWRCAQVGACVSFGDGQAATGARSGHIRSREGEMEWMGMGN
jgi:hypothetical protein